MCVCVSGLCASKGSRGPNILERILLSKTDCKVMFIIISRHLKSKATGQCHFGKIKCYNCNRSNIIATVLPDFMYYCVF